MSALSARFETRDQLYAIVNLPYPHPVAPAQVTQALIAGKVGCIQLRAKGQDAAKLEPLAREMAAITQRARLPFVVNDDLELALRCGADVLHVGQEDLAADPSLLERAAKAGLCVGLSTHTQDQFERAQGLPLAYVAIGPVYQTRSKSKPWPCVGEDKVRALVAGARHPVVAIGGIDPPRAASLWSAGVSSVAVIGALLGPDAASITAKARAFERGS